MLKDQVYASKRRRSKYLLPTLSYPQESRMNSKEKGSAMEPFLCPSGLLYGVKVKSGIVSGMEGSQLKDWVW